MNEWNEDKFPLSIYDTPTVISQRTLISEVWTIFKDSFVFLAFFWSLSSINLTIFLFVFQSIYYISSPMQFAVLWTDLILSFPLL